MQSLHLVDYDMDTWGVFGNTKMLKTSLRNLGGTFGQDLRYPPESTATQPGWLFSKTSPNVPALQELVKKSAHQDSNYKSSVTSRSPRAFEVKTSKSLSKLQNRSRSSSPSKLATVDSSVPKLYRYSEKAYAVFGDTKPIKDQLMKLSGKPNANLKNPVSGLKEFGYIFAKSSTHMPALKEFLQTLQTLQTLKGPVSPRKSTEVLSTHAFSLSEIQRVSHFELCNYFRDYSITKGLSHEATHLEMLKELSRNMKIDSRLAKVIENKKFMHHFQLKDFDLAEELRIQEIPYVKGMTQFAAAVSGFVVAHKLNTPEMLNLLNELTPGLHLK